MNNMNFAKWLESESYLQKIIDQILEKFPFATVWAHENKERIEITNIKIPKEYRGQGAGTEIIKAIQGYAKTIGKPIVLRPEAEKGYKQGLERFYKRLGFVHNRGRKLDFTLSSPVARTMYWRPNLNENYGHP